MDVDMSDIEANNVDNVNSNKIGTISNSKIQKKRKDYMLDDDSPMAARKKLAKRILLSLTKPSYVLRLDPKPLRLEHRGRLRYLLRRLVKQHDWAAASGVLSAYLKGTIDDRSPFRNRLKYSVFLELHKYMEDHYNDSRQIEKLYDTWSKKIGSMETWPVESRNAVDLEFILFRIMDGNAEDACQLAIGLEQQKVETDPVSKMLIGLAFYERWYSSIKKEFQWRDSEDQFDLQENSHMEGPLFSNAVGQSELNHTVESYMANSQNQCDSDASVMNDRDVIFNKDLGVSLEVDAHHTREILHQNFHPNDSYSISEEHEQNEDHYKCLVTQDTLYALGRLYLWLFPLRLPDDDSFEEFVRNQCNEYYKNAVKYLRLAVGSAPLTTSAALLPLIQLELIGGRVEETRNIIENECCRSASVLPIRLKAALLECSDGYNSNLLISCFEDILKKDPTCCDSLAKLISMHQNGDYHLESLLEMIALHLDATDAEHNTWSVFSSCFFKLSQCEDCASSCPDQNEDELRQHRSLRETPKIFREGTSGKSWRLRCRWWQTRHFCNSKLESEIDSGDLQLLTYKAACASYMYGQEFKYVSKAYSHLEKENDEDLLLILKEHKRNSFGFYHGFQKKASFII